jgi:predicted short-subunit dehydrogenase-like oxidoreductase (DUF2520 family)
MALVVEMGAEPLLIDEADRPAYAEAIAIATGFSTAIVAQATEALSAIGVENAGRILGGVVRSAVENALASASADTIDLSSIRGDLMEDDS